MVIYVFRIIYEFPVQPLSLENTKALREWEAYCDVYLKQKKITYYIMTNIDNKMNM